MKIGKIILREKRRRHVFRHFDKEAIGSSFDLSVFPHIHAVLDYVNTREPIKIISQSKNRTALLYHCTEFESIGNVGMARKSELLPHQIVKELRDGFTIEVGVVEKFNTTNFLCVVIEKNKEYLHLITAYPGEISEPFPNRHQTPEERQLSYEFWRGKVLLRMRE